MPTSSSARWIFASMNAMTIVGHGAEALGGSARQELQQRVEGLDDHVVVVSPLVEQEIGGS